MAIARSSKDGSIARWQRCEKYRARQISQWVYRRRADSFEAMTDLSKELRASLAERFRLLGTAVEKRHTICREHVLREVVSHFGRGFQIDLFGFFDQRIYDVRLLPGFQLLFHHAFAVASEVASARRQRRRDRNRANQPGLGYPAHFSISLS